MAQPRQRNFTNINAGLPGVLYCSVALGDYDNDGQLDILLTGTANGFGNGAITQLWRNLGDGQFAKISTDMPAVSQSAVACGDFDEDGRLDILLTGYASVPGRFARCGAISAICFSPISMPGCRAFIEAPWFWATTITMANWTSH